MISAVPDYYRVLEIPESATIEEVRHAYRKLAKKYHPDLHPQRQEWAQGQFKLIVRAYETLSDAECRKSYNLRFQVYKRLHRKQTDSSFTRSNRIQNLCKEVLNYLLEKQSNEAIRLYESLKNDSDTTADPLSVLDTKDYLDCKFLLGEAYDEIGRIELAIPLYEAVFQEEREEPRSRCYFKEVVDRLKLMYRRQMSKAQDYPSAVMYYDKAMELENQVWGIATLNRKMAETLSALDMSKEAISYLELAFQANPNLKGAQRICDRLQYETRDAI